jgi:catechol 2,3-dioxygenase-like lactoylglutathione lyase family enzyme
MSPAAAPKTPIVGPAVLTHGTLEDKVLAAARAVYEKVLGLRCVQHSPKSQLIAGRSGFGIVAVEAGNTAHPQGSENRWVVHGGDPAAVDASQRRATEARDELGLQSVSALTHTGSIAAFSLQDADGNWWEITSRSPGYYQSLFAKGDAESTGDAAE